MGSPSELTLDCKPSHNYSMLVNQTEQTQKLEDFLSQLEEERLKIDAFKRELPLCMQLLTNAMETSRQQLQVQRANQGGPRPVLEEFMPIKNPTSEEQEKGLGMSSDKATWMTTAQLWSQSGNETKSQPINLTSSKEADMIIGLNVSPKLGLDNKQRNGGAFLPFSKERNLCPSPTLALSSVDKEMEDKKCLDIDNGFSCMKREKGAAIEQGKGSGGNSSTTPEGQIVNNINPNINGSTTITTTATTTTSNSNNNVNNSSNGQSHRKARRCWSPDLHRRFVNALQMLGGSQVATPKQIRELMKVDGLTNDEVKSHLQKYRLHTRRPSPSPQTPGGPTPQLVVLGGIWVPPEYTTSAHPPPPTLYTTHPPSHAPPPLPLPTPHFCATPTVTQDFYTPPPPQPLLHRHNLHHVYQATTHGQSSPDCEERGGVLRDGSESIEDGKSESSSWKGESGENGEGKGLAAALREDGEESNGSDITLKF